MLAKRIISCLDIKDGQTVKGTNFVNLRHAGDPVEMARAYSEQGADEMVFLDITASFEGRKTFTELVKRIAANISIPFTVGGGIHELSDVDRLLNAGADKISVNSSAIRRPELIDEIAKNFGSQVCVLAVDAKQTEKGWRCYLERRTCGERQRTVCVDERSAGTWCGRGDCYQYESRRRKDRICQRSACQPCRQACPYPSSHRAEQARKSISVMSFCREKQMLPWQPVFFISEKSKFPI